MMSARLRSMYAVVLGGCFIACVYAMADDRWSQWDFNVYFAAARAFASGGNPYTPIHPHPGLNGDLVFQYPPLTLYLFLWTTLFSLSTAKLIWLGAKLVAVAILVGMWRRDFERFELSGSVAVFIVLGFNASFLRDCVTGNISTFEQLGLWLAFGFLVRDRPYAAAVVLGVVAQFKLLPIAFLALIPLVRYSDRWKPFCVGCGVFIGLMSLNQAVSPGLTHDYLQLFTNANLRMDDRGISNPSSLAFFRDLIDLTSYMPGLPYNRVSGTIAYGTYLVALTLILIRAGWNGRVALRHSDPRLLVYLGCALFAIAAPRIKDYSYILMVMPTLYVIRDLVRRQIPADYALLATVFMVWAQPQQSNVPGVTALVYMLQAYLPLFVAGATLVYLVRVTTRSRGVESLQLKQQIERFAWTD